MSKQITKRKQDKYLGGQKHNNQTPTKERKCSTCPLGEQTDEDEMFWWAYASSNKPYTLEKVYTSGSQCVMENNGVCV